MSCYYFLDPLNSSDQTWSVNLDDKFKDMDGQTEGQMDGQTDGQTNAHFYKSMSLFNIEVVSTNE